MSANQASPKYPLADSDELKVCTWRELRVVRLGAGRAPSAAKALAVLRYWRDHGEPPAGYVVEWPSGYHRVDVTGMGDE